MHADSDSVPGARHVKVQSRITIAVPVGTIEFF